MAERPPAGDQAGPFEDKAAARRFVWDALQAARVARFPLPPHGRIPNFAGADGAARRLMDHPFLAGVRRVKVGPDAPLRRLRRLALEQGLVVLMPTPRLRGGFFCLDPARIPPERFAEAVTLKGVGRWGEAVALRDLPPVERVITGSVAVSREGRRCGKGHGYGDIEYAVLRELGHPPAPVATLVHPLQVVAGMPADAHDLPVSLIVTPKWSYEIPKPPAPPAGIDWAALPEGALEEMPVLRELADGPW